MGGTGTAATRQAASRRTNAQRAANARGQNVNFGANTIGRMNAQTNRSGSIFSRAQRARSTRTYAAAATRAR